MNLKDQLFEAAMPFFLKECGDSSKEMIANNATSFDEMGMAQTAPGEFAQEEITDRDNLVNTAKLSNDTDFNEDDISLTVVSASSDNDLLSDMLNLGMFDNEEETDVKSTFADMLRCCKHDNCQQESVEKSELYTLIESKLNEISLEEAGFSSLIPSKAGETYSSATKAGYPFFSWARKNLDSIKNGEAGEFASNLKDIFPNLTNVYITYVISMLKGKAYTQAMTLAKTALANEEELTDTVAFNLINKYLNLELLALQQTGKILSEGMIAGLGSLKPEDYIFDFTSLLKEGDFAAVKEAFGKQLNANAKDTITEKYKNNVVVPVYKALWGDDSKASFNGPAAEWGFMIRKDTAHHLDYTTESVLTESDYAGNLSYNPDKRLNASDILNAVKNAVKPELAAALSVNKEIDANEEPSYAILNIDEKDLPNKLEIDTNTDKKVILKRDGKVYKFDK